jgi:hypothetical protein
MFYFEEYYVVQRMVNKMKYIIAIFISFLLISCVHKPRVVSHIPVHHLIQKGTVHLDPNLTFDDYPKK